MVLLTDFGASETQHMAAVVCLNSCISLFRSSIVYNIATERIFYLQTPNSNAVIQRLQRILHFIILL